MGKNALITSSTPLNHKFITKFLEQVSGIYTNLEIMNLLYKWPSEYIILFFFFIHQRTYLSSSKCYVLNDATEKLCVWIQNKESLAKSKMKNRLLTFQEPAATVQNLALSNRAADLREPLLNWECLLLRQGAAKVCLTEQE